VFCYRESGESSEVLFLSWFETMNA
jgi:hypothetical protein